MTATVAQLGYDSARQLKLTVDVYECSASCRQGKWWGGGSVSDVDCVGVECGGAVMAQW